jgi:predicted short-subunit dehydrogenase-like oxidoreductase (DUF2520 family)
MSFELMKPLVQETVAKAFQIPPAMAQAGPAVRGNKKVIEKHLAILEGHPEIRELYRVITESIVSMKRNE